MKSAAALLLAATLASIPAFAQEFAPLPEGEIIEFADLYSMGRLVVYEDAFYALDWQEGKVHVFSGGGERLRTIGSGKGDGPGEMKNPSNLVVGGGRVYVTERNGWTNVFETDGTFVNRLGDLPVMHINSNASLLGDMLYMGGFGSGRSEDDRMLLGAAVSLDGERVITFMPESKVSREYDVTMIRGGHCDGGEDGLFWCSQYVDYELRAFDSSSGKVRSVVVKPDYYRPIDSTQPPSGDDALGPWMRSWDRVVSVRSVGNYLLVQIIIPGDESTFVMDIVQKSTGNVVSSHKIESSILFVDREEQTIYLSQPATEEPVTRVKKVYIGGLIPGE